MSKTYAVKEIYYTLQGEGAQTGRAAVFCRFSGCNLWSGRAIDRYDSICKFCDTDFVGTDGHGGGKFSSADALADAIARAWGDHAAKCRPLVVCTGGEPLLQLDAALVAELHARGFEVAVETNGTQEAVAGLDWICVSPKASAPMKLTAGHELKLVFPQVESDAQPERFTHLDFRHFFLQPMDGPEAEKNTKLALEYCLANPQWRLGLQTHKMIGLR